MAYARLTSRQKKQIVADYLRLESYNAVAKLHGISDSTVKNVVMQSRDIAERLARKKAQDDADILAYMEAHRDRAIKIIEAGLAVLPDKIANAKSATEAATALGIIIDKWGVLNKSAGADVEDLTPLADMLNEGGADSGKS